MSLPATQNQWTLVAAPTASAPKALAFKYVASGAVPALPSPTSIIVNIKALALAARDLQILNGSYPAPHALLENLVPTGSGSGVVVAVGPGVRRWKVGDRAIPYQMPGHHYTLDLEQWALERSIGGGTHGTAQEYMVMDENDAVPAPPHLSYEELACMGGSAVTAWACLFGHTPCLVPGSTVLILGTGGVSIFAAQFALMSGSNIILCSSSDDKIAKAKEILQPLLNPTAGKDAIRSINYSVDTEWDKTVLAMTAGRGVDNVVEVAGWATCGKSVRCTRKGGLVAVTGYLSTYNKVPDEIVQQDLSKMILYSAANVRGVFVGNRNQSEQMMRAVERAGSRPVIAHTFDFKDLPKAYEALERAGHIGKIVVRVNP
ncbi:hypothetical protein EHS25_003090 [Saitozyma podzolica]|uniref:Enoyl reductase (ER) domain-containing protein n=1 Tax=Saitozyma podzolica TaxID=1890683 RepID=A0A427YCR9_9TREE|nr:hypothetical protein EHS25_003090 [Saitozyma podzolica]